MGIRMAARPASAGAFANNLREFESLRDFFTSATLVTLVDLPFVLLFIAIVWLIGGPVALVPAIAVPLVIGVGLLLQLPLNRVVRRDLPGGRAEARRAGREHQRPRDDQEHRRRGPHAAQLGAVRERDRALRHARPLPLRRSASTSRCCAQNLVTVGVVIFGVYRIGEGLLTVGALVACTIITGRAMAPLAQVAGILTRYHQARAAYDALDKVMALPVERPAADPLPAPPAAARRDRVQGRHLQPIPGRSSRRSTACRSRSSRASGSA